MPGSRSKSPAARSARSKSPSAKSTKAAKAAAPVTDFVSSTTALTAVGCWWAFIGTLAVVAPATLIEMYEVPLEELKKEPRSYAMVCSTFQSMGLWMICWAGLQSLIVRVGTKASKSQMCWCNVVCLTIGMINSYMVVDPLLAKLGMPVYGSQFNAALSVVFIMMNLCGWMSGGNTLVASADALNPLNDHLFSNPMESSLSENATRYVVVLCVAFGFMMWAKPCELMVYYQVPNEGVLKRWMAFILSIFGNVLFNVAIALSATLGMDKKTVSNTTRFMWALLSMMFVQSASNGTTVSLMAAVAKEGEATMPMDGTYFNCGLWGVGSLMFFQAMIGK